ncbi:MAG: hypothetical protein WCP77_20380, partial [Roseococcus sp.]
SDDTGSYVMAKRLLLGAGLNGCQIPLYQDPEVIRYVEEWSQGSHAILGAQMAAIRNKDTIAPWFANWQAQTDHLWQAIGLGRLSPEVALDMAAQAWLRLQSRGG